MLRFGTMKFCIVETLLHVGVTLSLALLFRRIPISATCCLDEASDLEGDLFHWAARRRNGTEHS